MIEEQTIFAPVNLLKIKIENWDYKKQRFLQMMNTATFQSKGEEYMYTSFYHERTAPYLKETVDILEREFGILHDYLECSSIVMTAWFQKYGPKQHHIPHHHAPDCQFASVIYLNHDPDHHYPTQFYGTDPFNTNPVVWSDPNASEGVWYIWPAGVVHGTLPCDNPAAPQRQIFSINLTINND